MRREDLEIIKHLTIADIIEFVPVMKMPLRDAKPATVEYAERHGIESSSIKIVATTTVALGLYK